MGKPFFNLVRPIRLLSAEKHTKRSIVPSLTYIMMGNLWLKCNVGHTVARETGATEIAVMVGGGGGAAE